MPLIEGVGDEVTLILGGFLLCIILMFAWLSTHTADIPLLREVGVIVVELSQRRSRTQNALSEEPLERDGSSSSITRESSSMNIERQRYEAGHRSEDTSGSQLRAETSSENNNIADRVRTSASPTSDDNTAVSSRAGDISSSGLISDNSEIATGMTEQASAPHLNRSKSGDQTLSDNLMESETLVPKASVVVDDNKGFVFPSEEEIRQRRVQYFQPAESVTGETHLNADDNKSPGLSEKSTSNSDNTRHLKDNTHSSSFPTSEQSNTAGATQESVVVDSRTSHRVSPSAADSNNIAGSSAQEDISDTQTLPGQEESSSSSKIRIKLKYMNETQRLVYAEPLDTIGEFRRTHFQAELNDNKWVRFIYNGQDLRDDDRTLQAYNVGDNCTMHCLVTAQPNLPNVVVSEEEDDSFMGSMMYPLFTVIILIVWYLRFTYRQYFSAMSTVCLIGISFLLALSYVSSLRTIERTIPPQRPGTSAAAAGGAATAGGTHQHVD